MAAILSTDVTYSLVRAEVSAQARKEYIVDLTFGDGVKTYPTGGVPLVRGNLGLPNVIEQFTFIDMAHANGFLYKYDSTNEKVLIYQGDNANVAAGPATELPNTATPAAATLRVKTSGF